MASKTETRARKANSPGVAGRTSGSRVEDARVGLGGVITDGATTA